MKTCLHRSALAFGLGIVVTSACAHAADARVRIIHINIGQGDATLILGPADGNGHRTSVLVDAGNIPRGGEKDGGKIVGAVLRKNGVAELDYFIATHYDADHIGGAIAGSEHMHGHSFILGKNNVPGTLDDDDGDGKTNWLDNNPKTMVKPDPEELGKGDDIAVKQFVDRGDDSVPSSKTYKKYKAMATALPDRRTSLENQAQVNDYEIDLGGGAKMTCLAANGFVRDRAKQVKSVNTENERSLCFLLRFGGFDYLIGGDTIGRKHGSENAEVEKAIGEYLQSQDINVDVLHVNHHGANNASSVEFLDAVAPEIVIISLGNGNGHHHPHENALRRLVEAGVYRIYQTEWGTTRGETPGSVRARQAIFQGDIILTTDGTTFDISTSRIFDVDD